MKKISALFVLLLLALTAFSQTVTLTFTGRDANNQHLPMDRVVIANATQGWQETIYYPDTVFTMGGTGIADNAANGDFGLKQNNPNPFTGTTYATLQTMDAGEVVMELADVNGRIVETQNFASLQPGNHQFRINVATAGIYFLTARQNGQTSSIKMVNNGQGATNRIEYQNFVDTRNNNNNVETWRAASLQENNAKNNAKGVATHPFTLGDDMIYKGYVTVNGTEYQSQMIHQNQFVSETFVLNFNVSAPTGLPTVTTDAATNVLGHSATCGGNVTADGGYSVLARGVCWSTNPNPIFNDNHVSCGDGLGVFSCQLTGLEVNTTCYVRAYAVNSVGTAYGEQESFTTNNVTLPTVITTSVTNITQNSATCGGNVTDDGGYSVLARGVCWSTSPNPIFNDNHVSCGDGLGVFSGQLAGLDANTTYYVRAYAVNSVGTAYGNQVNFTTTAFTCGTSTVTDYDNNTYNTVQIGSQCWMKENLRTTHYADGTSISLGSSTSTSTAYRYYPDDNSSNVSTYGYLYNWPAVMHNSSSSSANPSGVQGICPNGWHVPSDAEWTQLTDYVSSQSEYVCGSNNTNIAKALASTTGWSSSSSTCDVGHNPSANNATGFAAVPAGYYVGYYDSFGGGAGFWSATQLNSNDAYRRALGYFSANVFRNFSSKYKGDSVRCLRD